MDGVATYRQFRVANQPKPHLLGLPGEVSVPEDRRLHTESFLPEMPPCQTQY